MQQRLQLCMPFRLRFVAQHLASHGFSACGVCIDTQSCMHIRKGLVLQCSRHTHLSFAVEAFVDTDQRYLQADSGANRDDGCTAVTAILVGQNLIVANVGDSRAVLSKGGQGEPNSPCQHDDLFSFTVGTQSTARQNLHISSHELLAGLICRGCGVKAHHV